MDALISIRTKNPACFRISFGMRCPNAVATVNIQNRLIIPGPYANTFPKQTKIRAWKAADKVPMATAKRQRWGERHPKSCSKYIEANDPIVKPQKVILRSEKPAWYMSGPSEATLIRIIMVSRGDSSSQSKYAQKEEDSRKHKHQPVTVKIAYALLANALV